MTTGVGSAELSETALQVFSLRDQLAAAQRRRSEEAIRRVAAGETQVAVAKSLGLTQPAVSCLIKRSRTQ